MIELSVLHITIIFQPELIIFTLRNNKILKCQRVSMGKNANKRKKARVMGYSYLNVYGHTHVVNL